MPPDRRARLMLILLALVAVASVAAYMTLGVKGRWDFVLTFRGKKLAGLILVAHAIACSTVLFQTVTANRILTPSIMGFDALYVLGSTVLLAVIGSAAMTQLDARGLFAGKVVLMLGASLALFRWLFLGEERSLHRLLLVGVVIGIFLRTLAQFVQRLLDPNEFMVLSDLMFASFGTMDPVLTAFGWVLVAAVTLRVAVLVPRLDVMALGRPVGVNLGLTWRRDVLEVLGLVAVLVSVSTALVGPVTFFGLLAISLGRQLAGTTRHAVLLPATTLVAIILLVGGQTILERLFAFGTALGVVVEFVGGLVFILILLRKPAR